MHIIFRFLLSSVLASLGAAILFWAFMTVRILIGEGGVDSDALYFWSAMSAFIALISFVVSITYGVVCYLAINRFWKVNYLSVGLMGSLGGFMMGKIFFTSGWVDTTSLSVLLGTVVSVAFLGFMRVLRS